MKKIALVVLQLLAEKDFKQSQSYKGTIYIKVLWIQVELIENMGNCIIALSTQPGLIWAFVYRRKGKNGKAGKRVPWTGLATVTVVWVSQESWTQI